MAALLLCDICPGCATVWMDSTYPAGATITWRRLVHVDSWRLVANRQEATKKRTSDTGGKAVKFCADITDWTFEITNTLCINDWLYADILVDPKNPSQGKENTWFFFGWGCTHAPSPLGTNLDPAEVTVADFTATPSTYTSDDGIYANGTVNPPGFGMDNNGSDPATGDWTVEVALGPYFPYDTGAAGVGSYSVSDENPDNAEEQGV